MDNFFTKHIPEITAIIIAIIRYIHYLSKVAKEKKEATATKRADKELDDHQDYFPLPQPGNLTPAIQPPSLHHPLPHPLTHHQPMVTPPYPGIKKLVLPTQEQDPYKLYQAAYPQRTSQLSHLLGKYNTMQQAILIDAIFHPKT
jgi:hypothetical protein